MSIITPVYNAAAYIEETIKSVLSQTYQDWQLLLIDDASADSSVEIIDKYARQDSRIKLVQLEKNSGAAVARNKGIELAEGRFIAFLDSDDLWLPQKLEKQLSFMVANRVGLSYTSYLLIDEEGNITGKYTIPKQVLTYTDLLKTCSIGCLTAIYDTAICEKQYMELIDKRQDYTLWLKLAKKHKTYGLNESLAKYRLHNNSLSGNKFMSARYQWYVYYKIERLGFIRSAYYFLHYALNGFFKYR